MYGKSLKRYSHACFETRDQITLENKQSLRQSTVCYQMSVSIVQITLLLPMHFHFSYKIIEITTCLKAKGAGGHPVSN